MVGFAEVELDVETGVVEIKQYTAMTDCGTMLHPRSLGAQILGGSIQGMGIARSQKWVYDPVWGVAFAKRLYTARPPGILDVPLDLKWGAVEFPDPQTPVGAKGIGEPPVGAGSAAIASAISDVLGGKVPVPDSTHGGCDPGGVGGQGTALCTARNACLSSRGANRGGLRVYGESVRISFSRSNR